MKIDMSVFFRNSNKEEKSDMLIFCYNDKQNGWIKENELQVCCKVVSSSKRFKK